MPVPGYLEYLYLDSKWILYLSGWRHDPNPHCARPRSSRRLLKFSPSALQIFPSGSAFLSRNSSTGSSRPTLMPCATAAKAERNTTSRTFTRICFGMAVISRLKTKSDTHTFRLEVPICLQSPSESGRAYVNFLPQKAASLPHPRAFLPQITPALSPCVLTSSPTSG